MNAMVDRLARWVSALGAASLVAMTLIVVVDVGLRALSNSFSIPGFPIGISEEVVGYLLVLMTFLGVSITFREGALFRVRFLLDALPPAIHRVFEAAFLAITAIFCATMIWFTLLLVISSFGRATVAATVLRTPLYIPQAMMPVGFCLFLVFAMESLFLWWKRQTKC